MWIKKLLYKIYRFLNLFPLWCKLYQFIWEREYFRNTVFFENLRPDQADCLMQKLRWQADTAKELGDAVHHPKFVNAIINDVIRHSTGNVTSPILLQQISQDAPDKFFKMLSQVKKGYGQPDISMDCDDFALFAAFVLDSKFKPQVLTVSWSTGFWPWQIAGHAVCLYQHEYGLYGHIGNWGHSTGFLSVDEVVMSILSEVKMADKLVGFTIFEPEDLYLKNKK